MPQKNTGTNAVISGFIAHPLTNLVLQAKVDQPDGVATVTSITFVLDRKIAGRAKGANDIRLKKYCSMLREYLDGMRTDLSQIPIDLNTLTPFRRKVMDAARKIRYGKTLSYKELALRAGNCAAVRAVASVMRNNPLVLAVPCHRVVRSDGSVGGFMGSQAGQEVDLKKKLLKMEASKARARLVKNAR